MDQEAVLLTMVHISDLHFYHKLDGRDLSEANAQLPTFIASSVLFDGWLGHHFKAMSALDAFWRVHEKDGALLIVTGDLTANGHEKQFAAARAFLADRVMKNGLGLGYADWTRLSVSGNHDQWPGANTLCGAPTPGLTATFATKFPIVSTQPLSNGGELKFITIDTDADVSSVSLARGLARGSFNSQLKSLAKTLPARKDNESRILLLHHSMAAAPAGSRVPTLIIDDKTRKVLEVFIVDHDISIVLSGHQHVPRLERMTMSNGVEKKEILEARCGTTTQRDEFPYEVRERIPRNRHLPPNSLILHQVIDRGGRTFWRSQIHWRSKQVRFVKNLPHVSAYLPRICRMRSS